MTKTAPLPHHEQILIAALWYASLGWRVFPVHSVDDDGGCTCGDRECKNVGKHPKYCGWQKDATTDEAQIRRWFSSQFGETPNTNIGIATGAGSKIFVLDVDGDQGKTALKRLEKQHGQLPKTVADITGRGAHHVFQCESHTITNSSGVLATGLDIRGKGGLFVAPPSRHHSGRQYQWAPGHAPDKIKTAAAPGWLIDLISRPETTTAAETPTVIRTSEPRIVAQASKYLAACGGADENKKGGRKTLHMAGILTNGFALTRDAAFPLMVEFNTKCTPPWTEKQLWHKIDESIKLTNHEQPYGHLLNSRDRRNLLREAAGQWPTLADRFEQLGNLGPRMTTGFATLDANTRGGFIARTWVAVGGAPGAGKTTWLVQLALQWAQEGKHVALVASDEDPSGLVIRIGQLLGYDRKQLEEGVPHIRAAAAKYAREKLPNLYLVDGEDDDVTIESVSQALVEQRGTAQSIMIVDSIQTCRSDKAINLPDTSDTTRTRINLVVKAIKRAAKVDGHLILAASELNRGAYRSKKEEDRIDDLAAFKESGNIEYGAGICLVLRNVANVKGVVQITVPKNRLGPERDDWRMTINYATASYRESAKPVEDTPEQTAVHYKALVLGALSDGTPRSKREIFTLTKGKKDGIFATVDTMITEGQIVFAGKRYTTPQAARKAVQVGPKGPAGSRVPLAPVGPPRDPGTPDMGSPGPGSHPKKSRVLGPSKGSNGKFKRPAPPVVGLRAKGAVKSTETKPGPKN